MSSGRGRLPWGVAVILVAAGIVVALARIHGDAGAMRVTSAAAVNRHALPLGDGRVSTMPRIGYVDSCITHFGTTGGSQVTGPWINTTNHTWDDTRKIAVSGSVPWPGASLRMQSTHGRRVLTFNDLPVGHTSGVFPIRTTDPAYAYDRNPNRIAKQSFRWSLPLNPKALATPKCTGGGPIGVLLDGVALYNALDAEGRDAAAHEVLDRCAAHPDQSNSYHHHAIPPCLLNRARRARSTLVGYALDGYGIYVEKDARGRLPTDASLDACHGKRSRVSWNGRRVRIWHYVATLEYPYDVGCFHGAPISSGHGGAGGSGWPPGGAAPAGAPPGAGPPGA